MNYYVNITILPDPEFTAPILMNSLYSKFHKALCDLNSKSIGISFPGYDKTLGDVFRIHGSESELNDLQGLNWIGGMSGYCDISNVSIIPELTKHRTVSRKQSTMSNSKLNRLIKRGSIKESEIEEYKNKMLSKDLKLPFANLVSGSNGQRHRRYIQLGELVDSPVNGVFDEFGLSKTATVPWF